MKDQRFLRCSQLLSRITRYQCLVWINNKGYMHAAMEEVPYHGIVGRGCITSNGYDKLRAS